MYNQVVAMRPRQVAHGWKTREKAVYGGAMANWDFWRMLRAKLH